MTVGIAHTQIQNPSPGGSGGGGGGGVVQPGTLHFPSAVQQFAPLRVNLSTEGVYDWMWLGGYAGASLSGNSPEAANAFKCHWKLSNGRLLNNLRFTQTAQNAVGTDNSQFSYDSNAGDDAAFNESVNPANQPLVNRPAAPFWFSNNNNLFFYQFGFQWRDIALPSMAASTIKFYVYLNNATVTLAASLSDGSAADTSAILTNPGTAEYIVTLNAAPGSFGARLSASLMLTGFNNAASRVGISAVTMA